MSRNMLWIAAAVAAFGLMSLNSASAQADGDAAPAVQQAGQPAVAPAAEGDKPAGAPVREVREGAVQGRGEGEARQPRQRPLGKTVMHALTWEWSKNDPQVQQSVDKYIADQQALLDLQAAQLKIFKDAVRERPTNVDRDMLTVIWTESSIGDIREAEAVLAEDAKALNQRLRELRPAEKKQQEAAPAQQKQEG